MLAEVEIEILIKETHDCFAALQATGRFEVTSNGDVCLVLIVRSKSVYRIF